MYNRFVSGLGTVLEQLKNDDIEGNRIAGYSSIWTSNRNGRPAYSKPSECEVNGTICESKSEFDEMLGKFIPAFKKTMPRGPVYGLPVKFPAPKSTWAVTTFIRT